VASNLNLGHERLEVGSREDFVKNGIIIKLPKLLKI